MTLRALLLVNPHARNGSDMGQQLADLLIERGFEVVEPARVSAGETGSVDALIRRHRGKVDLVVLAGGDGTINAALAALVATRLPLAIVPLGTANDLARTLQVPDKVEAALDVILQGEVRQVDVGMVNDHHFINVASIGLGVKITKRLSKEGKAFWGVLSYLKTALQVVWYARRFRVEIMAGTTRLELKAMHIAVGNGRHYGGGMTVSDVAEIDDGLLDLYAIEVRYWWQLFGLLPALRDGTLAKSRYVSTVRSASIEIRTRKSLRVGTDGEISTNTPANFSVDAAPCRSMCHEFR